MERECFFLVFLRNLMFFVRLIPQRNALVHHIERCLVIPGLDLQPLRFSQHASYLDHHVFNCPKMVRTC